MSRVIEGYVAFTNANPKFDFSFLYPTGWDVREIEEEGYSQVFIFGPRNEDDTYGAGLTVSVIPARRAGGEFNTVDELVADYLDKSKGLPGFKQLFETRGSFASLPAVELAISYVLPLPLNSVDPKDTAIVERKIVTRKGRRFYELGYRAVEDDYHACLDAFRHAAQTFEFRRERTKRTQEFRPVVTPLPIPALREQTAEYETEK